MKNKLSYAIGVDLGGTNIVAGLVDSKGNVIFTEKIKTLAHLGRNSTLNRINDIIKSIVDRTHDEKIPFKNVKGIGIGAPGLVDHSKGIVREPPNLPGWEAVNLKKSIEDKIKIPAYAANDANAYAIGEHTFGAGRGCKDMVCITLGTGMGGGIIINKQLFVGGFQTAGEVGHISIDMNGPQCKCGNIGCIETYIGAGYISERAVKLIKSGKKTIIKKLVNNDLTKITPKVISEAANKKDKLAIEIWRQTGEYIGVALSSIINLFSPEVVVVGGGVSRAGDVLFNPIRKEVKKRVFKYLGQRVKIVPGELHDNAGVLGASSLVWNHID